MAEHRKSHWGTEAPYKYLNRLIVARDQYTTIKQVTQQCKVCLQSSPKTGPKAQIGQIGKGNYPGQQWQIDFSELPRKGGFDTCWSRRIPFQDGQKHSLVELIKLGK